METQSNTFIPKYGLITYVMPFAYFGISAFLIAFWIVVRYLLYGGDYWTGIYGGIVFAAAAIYDATRIVKAVEFDENEMIVRYHVWMEKVIDYREIKGIDVKWRYINAKGAKVYFGAMINQVELQTKVADILRSRKILDINLVEEGMKKTSAFKKRLRYALIFTIAVGLVAEFVGHADWSEFSIILVLYFVLAYLVLMFFIK